MKKLLAVLLSAVVVSMPVSPVSAQSRAKLVGERLHENAIKGPIAITGDLSVSGTITGAVTGAVTGNASTASALAANPSDCSANQFATAIAANGNLTCSAVANAATTAASANTASAIVARDGSGNFAAGTITAALTGNVAGNVAGMVNLTSKTLAELVALTPAVGDMYKCSNCAVPYSIAIATGTGAGNFGVIAPGQLQ